jgi:hypothetical protein
VNAKIGGGVIGRLGVASYLDAITAAGVKVNMRAKSRCTLSAGIATRCATRPFGNEQNAILRSFCNGVNSSPGGNPEKRQENDAVRNTLLALVIVAMATPALAQMGGAPNLAADGVKLKTDVEVKQEQEREAGYRTGLGKIPDAKAKQDPWGSVRGTPTPGQNQAKSNAK